MMDLARSGIVPRYTTSIDTQRYPCLVFSSNQFNLSAQCVLCIHTGQAWYNALTMLPGGGRQHRGCITQQAVTQV